VALFLGSIETFLGQSKILTRPIRFSYNFLPSIKTVGDKHENCGRDRFSHIYVF